MTRMKAHAGEDLSTFENIITGGAFIGGVVASVPPVKITMHRSPAGGLCDNHGV